ncbi:MAG: LptF/LptG family permease [Chlorobi bacterium]|nr:LptF/LptG family permease [Chlorobiota bacterium]MCI0716736.1 LptF/LptG family permease [Chlorobiota bacterium]
MLIYRYILKAHFAPFIISFFIIIFVFTFQFIYKYIDNLVGKGLSYWVIIQLITLNLAWMVTLAVPMAVLVATLMAFGSLTSTNETTIMQSSGLSPLKMILPVLLASGVLCYGLILFNNKILPEANHRTRVLMMDIQRTRPTFVIEAGRFTDDISGYNLLVRKTFENSNKLEGVFIIDNSSPVFSNTLTADSGQINFSSDYSKIILDLYNGEIHQIAKNDSRGDYRKIKFEKHIVTIDAQGFGFSKSDEGAFSRGDRELSADSMRNIVKKIDKDFELDKVNSVLQVQQLAMDYFKIKYNTHGLDSSALSQNEFLVQGLLNRYKGFKSKLLSQKKVYESNQRQINVYLVEIYKKYSIPFACVVFVLIGAPLGIITKKGGLGVAAGMSFGFFLLYWACLIGGEKLADRELLSPFLSMWVANIIIGIAGIYLIFRGNLNFNKLFKLKTV